MQKKLENIIYGADLCVFCGVEIPEGRMICLNCENGTCDNKNNTRIFTPASEGSEAKNNKSEGT